MNPAQYEEAARRTVVPYKIHPPHKVDDIDFIHSAIGLCTENTELNEQFSRHFFGGQRLDIVNVLEELGDLSWYHVLGYHSLGVHLELQWMTYQGAGFQFVSQADAGRLMEISAKLTSATGNLLDLAKRKMFYDDEKDVSEKSVGLLNEVGALIQITANLLSLDITTIRIANIMKLKERYPEKFTDFDAVERDLDAERQVLEAAAG